MGDERERIVTSRISNLMYLKYVKGKQEKLYMLYTSLAHVPFPTKQMDGMKKSERSRPRD